MSDALIVNPYGLGPPPDYYAWWRLDETTGTVADDAAATGLYDGTYVGAPTLGVAGKDGTAVTFDGVNDRIDVTTLGALGTNLAGKSLEFWIKTTTTIFGYLCGVINTGSTVIFGVTVNCTVSSGSTAQVNSGRTGFHLRTQTGVLGPNWVTQDIAYDGNWHHVVIAFGVVSGLTWRPVIYVDGELAGDVNVVNSVALGGNFEFPLNIGMRNNRNAFDLPFAGSLDNIIIHKTALTAEQAEARYTLAGGGTPYRSQQWSWWTRPRAVAYNGRLYCPTAMAGGAVGLDIYDSVTGAHNQLAMDLFENDDHNNGAIVIRTGKPPLMFYSKHAADPLLRYRVGDRNIEDAVGGVPDFGAEQTLTVLSGLSCYAEAHVHGANLYVFHRCASSNSGWNYFKSTGWGAPGTWSTDTPFITGTGQVYMASVLVGDVLRCAIGRHPTDGVQAIYYLEANLVTGVVSKADGTQIGTLGTAVQYTSGDVVYTVAAGRNEWVYDVGDGPNREIVFIDFDLDDIINTGTYRYAVHTGGAWVNNPVIASGKVFPGGGIEAYYCGIQIKRGTSGGVVYSCRHDPAVGGPQGTWKFERHVTANNGTSWTTTVIHSLASTMPRSLARVFPIEGDVASVPWDHVGIVCDRWSGYTNWRSHAELIVEP